MIFTKETTDYKAMYEGLYDDVAMLLVENRLFNDGDGEDADGLLRKWDRLRMKYSKDNK
jgi:hypothetical protein